mgnify:CR=1 FL=1
MCGECWRSRWLAPALHSTATERSERLRRPDEDRDGFTEVDHARHLEAQIERNTLVDLGTEQVAVDQLHDIRKTERSEACHHRGMELVELGTLSVGAWIDVHHFHLIRFGEPLVDVAARREVDFSGRL